MSSGSSTGYLLIRVPTKDKMTLTVKEFNSYFNQNQLEDPYFFDVLSKDSDFIGRSPIERVIEEVGGFDYSNEYFDSNGDENYRFDAGENLYDQYGQRVNYLPTVIPFLDFFVKHNYGIEMEVGTPGSDGESYQAKRYSQVGRHSHTICLSLFSLPRYR
jgi:hypothetical protein